MKPMLLWLEHVMGFEQMWEVEFHTSDVDPNRKTGSGLKSIVMWEPASGVKFTSPFAAHAVAPPIVTSVPPCCIQARRRSAPALPTIRLSAEQR